MGNTESQKSPKRHQSENSGKSLFAKSQRDHSEKFKNPQTFAHDGRKCSKDSSLLQLDNIAETQKSSSGVPNRHELMLAGHTSTASHIELPFEAKSREFHLKPQLTLEHPVPQRTTYENSFIEVLPTEENNFARNVFDNETLKTSPEVPVEVVVMHGNEHTHGRQIKAEVEEFKEVSEEADTSPNSVKMYSACVNSDESNMPLIDLVVEELLEDIFQLVIQIIDSDTAESDPCGRSSTTLLPWSATSVVNYLSDSQIVNEQSRESNGCIINNLVDDASQEFKFELVESDAMAEGTDPVMVDTENSSVVEEVTVLLEQLVCHAARGRLKSILCNESFSDARHHKDAHVQFCERQGDNGVFPSRKLSGGMFNESASADSSELKIQCVFEKNNFDTNVGSDDEDPVMAAAHGNVCSEDGVKLVRLAEDITTNVILSSIKLIESEDIFGVVNVVLESVVNDVAANVLSPNACEEHISSRTVVDLPDEAYKPCSWSDTTSSASSNQMESWITGDLCSSEEISDNNCSNDNQTDAPSDIEPSVQHAVVEPYDNSFEIENKLIEETSTFAKDNETIYDHVSVTVLEPDVVDNNENTVDDGFNTKIASGLLEQSPSGSLTDDCTHATIKNFPKTLHGDILHKQNTELISSPEPAAVAPEVILRTVQIDLKTSKFHQQQDQNDMSSKESTTRVDIIPADSQSDTEDNVGTQVSEGTDKNSESSNFEVDLATNEDDSSEGSDASRESRLADRGSRLLKRKQQEASGGMKLRMTSLKASSIAGTSAVYNHSASSSLSEPNSSLTVENLTSSQELKSAFQQLEDKYRQAMVQSAQLDNERSQLQYQTQQLKDLLEEQEDDFYRLQSEHRASCQEVERQKRTIQFLEKKCQDLQEALCQRDELIQEQGLVVVGGNNMVKVDGRRSPDHNEYTSSKLALVTPEAAEVLQSAGDGPLDLRLKNLAEEKQELQDQVRRLQEDLEEERKKVIMNGDGDTSRDDARLPEMQLLEVQREANKVVNEYKLRLQKSEQDVIACHANIARLEGQLGRLKQTTEMFERNEDDMRAEKRKLMRDLRTALDRIEEVEMTNSHLEKRLERFRASRAALGQT